MRHNIQIQAWGDTPVVVCMHCGEGSTGKLLARGTGSGISFADAVNAIEEHTGEGAFRASVGAEPDLVAGGPVDEFPEGYHPRTGQKIEE